MRKNILSLTVFCLALCFAGLSCVTAQGLHTVVIDAAVPATCTGNGLTEGQHCSLCGKVLVPQNVVAALGHRYEGVITEASCTVDGWITYTCTTCGDSCVGDPVNALGHSYGEGVITTEPTCEDFGEQTFICSACGHIYVEEVDALGHHYETVVTAPTCTEKGYTTHTCSVCGDTYTDNEVDALGALDYLKSVYNALCDAGLKDNIMIDLGLVNRSNYYTGVIFHGYAEGSGLTVLSGGRYDNLLEKFGKKAPAIGFVIVVDDVLEALSRQKIVVDISTTDTLIVYKEKAHANAFEAAKELRDDGCFASLLPVMESKTEADYENYALANRFAQIIYIEENGSTRTVSVPSNGEDK